ncbi:hypothetical protein M231_02461 [Tremella mesenterica]|uniref:Uncharacterized protein n=1 Tax=Tremella mesenterica TaxID=5217 RepID=A0A4V1M4F5_TREME|nr:hypothetical protein M231_02461 [Tremella mesenterica]
MKARRQVHVQEKNYNSPQTNKSIIQWARDIAIYDQARQDNLAQYQSKQGTSKAGKPLNIGDDKPPGTVDLMEGQKAKKDNIGEQQDREELTVTMKDDGGRKEEEKKKKKIESFESEPNHPSPPRKESPRKEEDKSKKEKEGEKDGLEPTEVGTPEEEEIVLDFFRKSHKTNQTTQ